MNLPDKFFVEDTEHEIIWLIEKDKNIWWMQLDFTHDDYDPNWDTSGTIAENDLKERIQTGKYKILPDDEGWMEI